jgi:hypothetical protein
MTGVGTGPADARRRARALADSAWQYAAFALGLPPFAARTAGRPATEARRLAAYLLAVGADVSLTATARLLGCDRASVRRDLAALEEARSDPMVDRQLDELMQGWEALVRLQAPAPPGRGATENPLRPSPRGEGRISARNPG